MGDPKKQRKKYSTPTHPWQAVRIEKERELSNDYGLKNKKEIWRMESLLRKFKRQARNLIASSTEQGEREKKQLMTRLVKLNLISDGAKLDDVLELNLKNILDRRLQTITYKLGLARTIEQARQFIVHGHILVNDKKINVPSYIVPSFEETKISFNVNSSLFREDHPERSLADVKKELKREEEIVKPIEEKVVEIKEEKLPEGEEIKITNIEK